jgi:hypothetical protein
MSGASVAVQGILGLQLVWRRMFARSIVLTGLIVGNEMLSDSWMVLWDLVVSQRIVAVS